MAGRGQRDAPAIGREIARRGYRPDLILCSTARRTAETLDLVLPFFVPPPSTRLEPALYHAGAALILARASSLAAAVGTVMFVGHNPGLEELALDMAGDTRIRRRIAAKFPTAAFAAFESSAASWSDAVRGRWIARDFLSPADL
ncbi:MAG: histidine phosphatase family protein [Alphaproteobacteria bacterium]|nr:histidine phosphatase family protein [Alphaproteobacteria bacterium]